MADDRFPSRFAADASLLPHMADLANDRVLIALLGEADYRAASFLDQRLLTDRVGRAWRAWNALPDLGAAAPRPAFILLIGHEIGRAPCRERVCQHVIISGDTDILKNKKNVITKQNNHRQP